MFDRNKLAQLSALKNELAEHNRRALQETRGCSVGQLLGLLEALGPDAHVSVCLTPSGSRAVTLPLSDGQDGYANFSIIDKDDFVIVTKKAGRAGDAQKMLIVGSMADDSDRASHASPGSSANSFLSDILKIRSMYELCGSWPQVSQSPVVFQQGTETGEPKKILLAYFDVLLKCLVVETF